MLNPVLIGLFQATGLCTVTWSVRLPWWQTTRDFRNSLERWVLRYLSTAFCCLQLLGDCHWWWVWELKVLMFMRCLKYVHVMLETSPSKLLRTKLNKYLHFKILSCWFEKYEMVLMLWRCPSDAWWFVSVCWLMASFPLTSDGISIFFFPFSGACTSVPVLCDGHSREVPAGWSAGATVGDLRDRTHQKLLLMLP